MADDLLQMISEELRERRFARVVRLEVEPGMPDDVRQFLVRQLELDEEDLYEIPGLLEMSGFWQIAAEGPWEHRHEPWEPMIPPAPHPRRRDGGSSRHLHGDSRGAISWCTTRTSPSPRRCSSSSRRPPRIPRSWPSSRRSTGRRSTRGSSPRWCGRPRRARRVARARGGHGPLRRGRQHGVGVRAGGGGRQRHVRSRRAEDAREGRARRPRGRGRDPHLLPTSARATTTPRPRRSTRTSGSSRRVRRSAAMR